MTSLHDIHKHYMSTHVPYRTHSFTDGDNRTVFVREYSAVRADWRRLGAAVVGEREGGVGGAGGYGHASLIGGYVGVRPKKGTVGVDLQTTE